ncbi:hypothetical protein SLEP1_g42772 [Rubroshorea leprosula]|uniref:Retrotransposon Copia-like N-terminal domain-containing protein n=1 Tax=Rubroshorea leprosula TaxID=152421 RepID=A0AAV5LB61_9ROSI|nr:hypothetical protein SLEP1_g42772 [Rubroshorea leprosula]
MAKTSTASASGDSSPTSGDTTSNPNSAATIINQATRGPISFNLIAFPLKLAPTNYLSWKTQFTSHLAGYELLGYLDGTLPCPVATKPDYSLWARQDKLLRHALITPSQRISCLTLLKHPLLNKRGKCWPISMPTDELGTVDRPLTDDDLTIYILNRLGPKFHEIVASLRTRDSSLSFDDLHDQLVAHEESLHREEIKLESVSVSAHYATFPTHSFPAGASSTSSTTSSGFLLTPFVGRISQSSQPTRNNHGGPTYNKPNLHDALKSP